MASYFRKTRNVELSCVDYLTTEIANSWSAVTVVKSFLDAYAKPLPVVCIRLQNSHESKKEIGNDDLKQEFTILIDIFAKNDGMRLDLADFITDTIKSGYPYYVFSHVSGNNALMEKIQSGYVHFVRFGTNNRVDFFDTPEDQDKYRHLITITVSK